MAIKVIVELQAKPGKRDELKSLIESIVAKHGPGQSGFLGSTRYEVIDNPDMLVEIADWESAERRAAHMQEAAATGVYAPLSELLAAPFRATVIRQLSLTGGWCDGQHAAKSKFQPSYTYKSRQFVPDDAEMGRDCLIPYGGGFYCPTVDLPYREFAGCLRSGHL